GRLPRPDHARDRGARGDRAPRRREGPGPAEGGPLRPGAGTARDVRPSGGDRLCGRPPQGDRGPRLLAHADPQVARDAEGRGRGGPQVKRIPLYRMAHARSGDKGDGSNVGVLAYDDRGYGILQSWLTPERVKAHF